MERPNEKYIPERLPPAAQQAIEGTVIETAEGVARRCHEAVRPDQAREYTAEQRVADRRAGYFAVNRVVRPCEAMALLEWAQATGLMLDGQEFTRRWEEQDRKGETEHAIYFDSSTERWFKLNNLSNHGNWLEFFHRLALHNWLFPEAPLRFEGFLEFDKELLPLTSQPHIVGARGASEEEIDQLMKGLSFEPIRGTNPTRRYDYINREIGVEVNDLHDENVIFTDVGETVVIDPVPMMEQATSRQLMRLWGVEFVKTTSEKHPCRCAWGEADHQLPGCREKCFSVDSKHCKQNGRQSGLTFLGLATRKLEKHEIVGHFRSGAVAMGVRK